MLCCRPRTRVRLRRPECRLQTGTASRLMLRSVAERGRHNHSSLSWPGMAGLVPAISLSKAVRFLSGITGTSPVMTRAS
jgi:hypothetical protein